MQTFRAWATEKLVANGLFESQAEQVIAATVLHMDSTFEARRWDEKMSDYPPLMQNLIWFSTKKQAVLWIKANHPEHWCLPMFEDPA